MTLQNKIPKLQQSVQDGGEQEFQHHNTIPDHITTYSLQEKSILHTTENGYKRQKQKKFTRFGDDQGGGGVRDTDQEEKPRQTSLKQK